MSEVHSPSAPSDPTVLTGRLATSTEAALIKYAEQVVIKSPETALDFHKTMLGISATFGTYITTLVPIFILGDKDMKIPSATGWPLLIPSIMMLTSSVCFAIGYYPRNAQINPNDIGAVRKARDSVINQRKYLAVGGLASFCFALILMVGLGLFFKARPPE